MLHYMLSCLPPVPVPFRLTPLHPSPGHPNPALPALPRLSDAGEPRARARVCSVLDWHSSTLRVGSMITVWNRAISLK